MRTFEVSTTAIAGLLAACFALPALAQDAGGLDEASAERVYPDKHPYSPYADRDFPNRPPMPPPDRWGDADKRQPDAAGKLPPVGNTVDVANATWTNTIGAAELITVWEDPDFDASEAAFYYARVIEIPTPRWTAYEAKRFGVTMPEEVPMTTQERAYTSPIWYTP